ncbi:MAG: hypothetical protein Q7K65_04745 [Candidatus Buchananbacteria bacterium]|nr:hypothetical protein [Candidatus Buchananbacteria bacterium]
MKLWRWFVENLLLIFFSLLCLSLIGAFSASLVLFILKPSISWFLMLAFSIVIIICLDKLCGRLVKILLTAMKNGFI